MSASHRYLSCACCGALIGENDRVTVEILVIFDWPNSYVPVLEGHSTFPSHSTWIQSGVDYVRRVGLS